MIGLAGYDFDDHTASFICSHVRDGSPVLAFSHDDDGDLQFLCGAESHSDEKPHIVCLHHVTDKHPEVFGLPTVDFGHAAYRDAGDGQWTVIFNGSDD